MLGICADIERYCPEAFLINLTNPLSRVALAINTGTSVRNVSMCHEFAGGLARIAGLLRIPKAKIEAKASGINHFTFFTDIRRSDTGEDLYPRLRQLWRRRYFDYPAPVTKAARQLAKVPLVQVAVEQMYAPLVAHMFREYGLLPCSVDSHIGEYVPFAEEVAGWHPVPVYFHQGIGHSMERLITRYGNGESRVPMHRAGRSAEEVFPIIGAMWTDHHRPLNAVNVPNRGYVPNLPDGAIVEVPATVDGKGISPDTVPPILEPLAEFMRTQIELQELVVRAALTGDPEPAYRGAATGPAVTVRRGLVPHHLRRAAVGPGRGAALLSRGPGPCPGIGLAPGLLFPGVLLEGGGDRGGGGADELGTVLGRPVPAGGQRPGRALEFGGHVAGDAARRSAGWPRCRPTRGP